MKNLSLFRAPWTAVASGLLSVVTMASSGQTQMQAAAPPPSPQAAVAAPAQPACGNQPLCSDTADFTATITDFRLTAQNGIKVIDVVVRYQNKTSDTLILGYADGSMMALDDQGNRYGPNPWQNAYRGIGVVSGNNMDPKFVLRPGGWGDARFELVWRPGAQDPIGNAFELAMSIREITTLAGNQHVLGGEFPLHFQGLANGVTGVSPSYSNGMSGGSAAVANGGNGGGLPPCGAAGTVTAVAGAANGTGNQTAVNAASKVSNAAATLSSLASVFGHKKQPDPNAASNPANGTPCAPSASPAQGNVTAFGGGAATTAAGSGSAAAVVTTNTAASKATTQGAASAVTPVRMGNSLAGKAVSTTPALSAKPSAAVTAKAPAATAARPVSKAAAPVVKKPVPTNAAPVNAVH